MNNINIAPGLATLLTCIFVVAKIWGKINWNWWWVFSPIWIPISIILVIVLIVIIIAAIMECF